MKRSGNMPKRQPQITPKAIDPTRTARTPARSACSGVTRASGSPIFAAAASTKPPNEVPATSEQHCPKAAAVKVDTIAEKCASMASPTVIMIVLSTNPNPIIGTAHCSAYCSYCFLVSGRTLPSGFSPCERCRFRALERGSSKTSSSSLHKSIAVAGFTGAAINMLLRPGGPFGGGSSGPISIRSTTPRRLDRVRWMFSITQELLSASGS
mmetsp:Transcript_1327/g.2984  ORF Transcript_1327/g.2984 Transcript_1327/m.2984 type:complete len:210 (-) Transcript_1327:851-1480(-)